MVSKVRYVTFLLVLLGTWGCGQKGAKLQKSVVPPDKTLFETGQEYAQKSQFIKARLAFQTLINTYPDSELSAESYLAIGDSFYKEGGTENLLQAEDQYKNFIIFFPTHPKAADAQMKIASGNMKMMRDPDRDPQYSAKAQEALQKFIEMFPDHPFTSKAREYLRDVQENLAAGFFGIGKFYATRGNYVAARQRFESITKKFPEFSEMEETYYQLAKTLEKSERSDDAAIYYGRIAEGYPFGKHFEEAKARLEEMGKPVPPVNTEVAAKNQARQKPSEGFSPLSPITAFAKAIGFRGPHDAYETAKKEIESKAETAAPQTGNGPAGDKPADDALIKAEIRKSQSGATEATLGSAPKETQPSTDKNGGGKNNSKKKKNDKKPS